jgi:tetratricopeptide (TPR) repeat protein
MKSYLITILFLLPVRLLAQATEISPFDANYWGVVLEHSEMKNVQVQKDILYFKDDKRSFYIDIYLPPKLGKNEKRPAIVFLNGLGDREGQPTSKSKGIYASWPRLVAAHGYIGISMESDGNRIHECFDKLFSYLAAKGITHQVDAEKIGVYAASANIRNSITYLMKPEAFPGIKAAALYYGEMPRGPFRKDLPVLFVVAEKDIRGRSYADLWAEVLKNKSPWTIKLATGLPHAFDAFANNDDAKKVVLETISFWKNHLDPVPASTTPPSIAKIRDIIAAQYDGDYANIVHLMREWANDNPDSKDVAALNLFSHALMRTDDFAEAEKYYKKSLSINPNNKGVMLDMVIVSYALGKPAEAEKYLVLYEKDTSPEGFTYGYVGRTLVSLKKYKDAAQHFERSIVLGPHPSDYYNLAMCYTILGDKDKAFINLKKAAEKGFENRQGYETNTHFEPLKSDPRWQEVLKILQ